MVNEAGQVITTLSSDFAEIMDENTEHSVNVEVSPSFQILEYTVAEDEVRFVDDVPHYPQVYFYNQPHKASGTFSFPNV